MEPKEASSNTHQQLTNDGYQYDSSNKAYYRVSQENGVEKLYANDDRVCKPDSNDWQKYEDSK